MITKLYFVNVANAMYLHLHDYKNVCMNIHVRIIVVLSQVNI